MDCCRRIKTISTYFYDIDNLLSINFKLPRTLLSSFRQVVSPPSCDFRLLRNLYGGQDGVAGRNPGFRVLIQIDSGSNHAADSCLIEELIVKKDARAQGVAGALIEELIRHLDKKICVEISVSVMADNASAIRFYKSHGLTDESLYLERHF